MSPSPELPGPPPGLVADFLDFLRHEKAWWMTPIVIVLVGTVAFIVFFEASPLIPIMYAGLG